MRRSFDSFEPCWRPLSPQDSRVCASRQHRTRVAWRARDADRTRRSTRVSAHDGPSRASRALWFRRPTP